MFLNIKANNFICFYKTSSKCSITTLTDEFNINLSSIDEIVIKKCALKVNSNNNALKLKYQIEFDRFIEEGILNYFTLFFTNKQNKEFKRIKKIIKGLSNGKKP